MLGRTFWLISSVSDKLIIRTIILCVSKFTSYFGLPYFIAYSSSIRISLVHNNIITTFKVVGYQRIKDMDIDESADQLLNNLQIQISIEHIPFDLIRNNRTVTTALQNLVTRAYFDRNYTKRDTRNKIDSLIIAVLNVLKTPIVDLTADTEDESASESASPEQQPDLAAGPSRATEQPAAVSEEQDDQEPVQEPPRKRSRTIIRPEQFFGDEPSSGDDSEIEILESVRKANLENSEDSGDAEFLRLL